MQQDCNHCQDLLWSYLTEELSDSETEKITEHLQGCPSCQAEADRLALVVASLQEEISLPANFSTELHKKLTLAAEEMASEKASFGKRITQTLKDLAASRGFRTLAPSLVCLVLVVGVFSSGLFEQWQNSDRTLTQKPAPVSTPVETPATNPEPPNPIKEAPPAIEQPSIPEAPSTGNEPTSDSSMIQEYTPSAASMADIPAPASMGEDVPVGFAIPRQPSNVSCLTVSDVRKFLDNWKSASGYDWNSYLIDADAQELPAGIDANATILQLPAELTESLLSFEETYPTAQDDSSAEESEFLIIITEDEE